MRRTAEQLSTAFPPVGIAGGARSGARRRASGQAAASGARRKALPWPVSIFLVSLVIPWVIAMGPLSMSIYRLVLVVMIGPCLIMWLRGQAGRIRAPDIGILLFCAWGTISLMAVHGVSAMVQSSGILFVETMGAYLLARCYIRDVEDFENAIVLVAKMIALLFPFAVYEWLTGHKPILTTLSAIFPTAEITMGDRRLGFYRVQGPFAHPILFGLFCASVFSMMFFIAQQSRVAWGRFLTFVVAATTILSMSSAPLAGLALQGALLTWNWVLRQFEHRWKLLWALIFAAYLVVEFGSNQTPAQFYISRFTFDGGTGWHRLFIWQYGSATVLNHPLWGIGFGDWERPKWLYSSSVDNFWLVIAMRHGIPAILFMLGSCVWLMLAVAVKRTADLKLQTYHVGYLIALVACMVVGTTVHFWAAVYVWFMFLLGSGVWFLDAQDNDSAVAAAPEPGGARRARGMRAPTTTRRRRDDLHTRTNQ